MPPRVAYAAERLEKFLTSRCTVKRNENTTDDMGGVGSAVTTVFTDLPCSYQPFRLPELLADVDGRLASRSRWIVVFAAGTAVKNNDLVLVDGITLQLQAPQTPVTLHIDEKFIAELVE